MTGLRAWRAQLRADLAPYLPHLAAAAAITTTAGLWHFALGWPLLHLAVVVLAALAALQEARILAVHRRLENHLVEADEARGPIAPAFEPDEPWQPAEPLQLAPVEPFGHDTPPRPSPFPPRPTPRPVPAPQPETHDDWLARIGAEHQAAMARITATGPTG